jgi:hypothetical protein
MSKDSEDFVDNFISHFGVKGMRWGRRSADTGSSDISSTDVKIKTAPGRIEVAGGKGRMPSQDAIDAVKYRQIAKASSSHALSNKELRALVDRMNLEQQYSKAIGKNQEDEGGAKVRAATWVADKLKSVANMALDTAVKIQVTEQVNKAMNVEERKASSQVRVAKLVKAKSG